MPANSGLLLRAALLPCLVAGAFAATPLSTTPLEGLRDASPRVHALVGARIVTAPDTVIENGTLVVRDGVIEAVGAGLAAPADARVWDVSGRTLYAGFIESDSSLFLPAAWKSASATRDAGEVVDPAPATPPPAPATLEPAAGAHAGTPREPRTRAGCARRRGAAQAGVRRGARHPGPRHFSRPDRTREPRPRQLQFHRSSRCRGDAAGV
jgi:hypothetical protein